MEPPSVEDLRRDFDLDVSQIVPHEGGFEGRCWRADTDWIVKVWGTEPPCRLSLLADLAERGIPVAVPRTSTDGALTARFGGRSYSVFPYIRGRPAGNRDWSCLARMLARVHEIADVDLPTTTMAEPHIAPLRDHLDHPWIRDRRGEVASFLDRLDDVIERARSREVHRVLCHTDFLPHNVLMGPIGRVVAVLDWDYAVLAPREHDIWIAAESGHIRGFLETYGADKLDLVHVEYALLARALRDMTARLVREVDRPGVTTWGLDRLARLEDDLATFGRFAG